MVEWSFMNQVIAYYQIFKKEGVGQDLNFLDGGC